ncbi:MAG: hypothetical protein IKH92_02995 [Clostridiales bacterium]|nr:hypothetical protein [Clostridiales bacterium]
MGENKSTDMWDKLTHEQKNHILYLKQRELLNILLSHNAISKAQHDKSLHDLTVKMGESL